MKIDPILFLDNMPKDKPSAYRVCVFVMNFCAPLRMNEILSIIPEDEVFQTLPDGNQLYGWRYKPEFSPKSSNEDRNIAWIPESLAPVAQKAICHLREFQLEVPLNNYFYKSFIMRKFPMSCSEYRSACADAYIRSLDYVSSLPKSE